MQAKGAVHWEEQRAGYQTMEDQVYMGHPPRILGIRRSAAPRRPADKRAALQPLAAATQGKGNAPGVSRRRGPHALRRDVRTERQLTAAFFITLDCLKSRRRDELPAEGSTMSTEEPVPPKWERPA